MDDGLKDNLKKAVTAIRKANKVLIVAHINPDGDTIGCLLALGLALLHTGKKITMACQDGVPSRFQFLPGSELIASSAAERADVAIAVDCGSARQMGSLRTAFFKARTTIQIDHHDFGESFGKIQVLENEASAVGEIVYELIRALNIEISPAIAACLLTSIIIDTGSFRFSNIRPKTFDICSRLIKKGVDLQSLIEDSYWIRSRAMTKLISYCLLHAEFSENGTVAWSMVTQKDIRRFGAKLSDADSVADDLRSIEGVKITAVFRQIDKSRLRVSLRSKHGINVAEVATNFGGGGHHNAAGCSIRHSAAEKKKLLKELEALIS